MWVLGLPVYMVFMIWQGTLGNGFPIGMCLTLNVERTALKKIQKDLAKEQKLVPG
jgi:hypothetical protein